MSERLIDALQTCLDALERGETLDAALARYPAQADKLRPLIEASLRARDLSVASVPGDVMRRGRARLVQRAAELRRDKRVPRRTWLYNFRPVGVTLVLLLFLISSTGLVRASSASLPGDNLYPVKRTWEDVRLLFVFSHEEREGLQMTYESERLDETSELLSKRRVETVSFSGYVTAQSDHQWTISGIPVVISTDTNLPNIPIMLGSAVTITGVTTADGVLQANSIVFVPTGVPVPTPKPEDGNDDSHNNNSGGDHNSGGDNGENNDNNGTEATPPPDDSHDGDSHNGDSNKSESTPTPDLSSDGSNDSGEKSPTDTGSQFDGVVQSMNGNVWVVSGQTVNVSGAVIVGTPTSGANVTIQGYFTANGVFVATRVIFGNDGGSGGGGFATPTPTPSDGGAGDDDTSGEH